MDENTLIWLYLSQIFPIASERLYKLLEIFENPKEVLIQLKENNIPNLLSTERELIFSTSLMHHTKDIAYFCEKNQIKIIPIDNKFYPQTLLNISDPPLLLYCKGDLNCLNSKYSAALIGARKASRYSLNCAEKFGECLAQNGITVISGFALGVDTSAHNGALKGKGKTIAVLGNGICYDYPCNTMYLKEVIANNGAVISEYPPLDMPKPINFKVRNRIISGLSKGILVIEAGKKSGSLNTVSHALDQGRDIFVIPPRDIFDNRYEGQINLLRDGAELVYSPEDFVIRIFNSF